MKSTKTILATMLILFFGCIYNIQAQQNGEFGKARLLDELNLSEVQEKQVSDLRYEHQKQTLDLKNEIAKNRLEIEKMMRDNEINEKALKDLTGKNSDIQAQLKQLHVDHWLKVYNVLDEKQKEVWTKTFDEMGRRGMDRDNFMRGNHDRMEMRENPFRENGLRERPCINR